MEYYNVQIKNRRGKEHDKGVNQIVKVDWSGFNTKICIKKNTTGNNVNNRYRTLMACPIIETSSLTSLHMGGE